MIFTFHMFLMYCSERIFPDTAMPTEYWRFYSYIKHVSYIMSDNRIQYFFVSAASVAAMMPFSTPVISALNLRLYVDCLHYNSPSGIIRNDKHVCHPLIFPPGWILLGQNFFFHSDALLSVSSLPLLYFLVSHTCSLQW